MYCIVHLSSKLSADCLHKSPMLLQGAFAVRCTHWGISWVHSAPSRNVQFKLVTSAVFWSLVDQVGASTMFQKPPITCWLVDALHTSFKPATIIQKQLYQKVAVFLEHYSWFLSSQAIQKPSTIFLNSLTNLTWVFLQSIYLESKESLWNRSQTWLFRKQFTYFAGSLVGLKSSLCKLSLQECLVVIRLILLLAAVTGLYCVIIHRTRLASF